MTSESNRNKNANHWQELADQLGISDEGQPTAAPAKVEASAPPPAPAERYLPAPRHDPRPEIPAEPPVERHVPEMRRHHQTLQAEPVSPPPAAEFEAADDTRPIQSEMTPDEIMGSDTEGPPSGEEGASPRTAGRRRRRRRSSGKNKTEQGAEAAAAGTPEMGEAAEVPPELPAAAPMAERPAPAPREENTGDSGNQRGRSRTKGGRRHRDEEPEVTEEPIQDEDDVHESGGAVGFEEESDDEELVNYSNWTVPAWKDLIGSLYRPER
ncbi:MAG TPA: hypothetical protein VGP68_06015 [Gemmataceae bacterium]|nr:hypothetical protein [Gemmataceae bacterium]